MNGKSQILTRRWLLGAAGCIAAAKASSALGTAVAAGRSARPGSTLVSGRLDIAGNHILAGGKPVRLVGVAVGDPVFVRKGRPLSDYKVIARDWFANTVRISAHPTHWRRQRDGLTRALAADIAAARAAGLVVILDWHAIGFPGGYTERPDPSWGLPQDAYESDFALAASFWEVMARTFGADPGVIFELWNEPVVDNGLYVSTGQHWPQLKAVWLKLIEVIRKHSEAIILASGDRFAHDLKHVAANLIGDPRVAYAWHCYAQMDQGMPNRWPDSLDGLPAVKPVVVTEWGFARDDAIAVRGTPEDFGTPLVETVLERFKLHSTAWVWASQAGPQMFDSDGVETEFGKFVHGYLSKVARSGAGQRAAP